MLHTHSALTRKIESARQAVLTRIGQQKAESVQAPKSPVQLPQLPDLATTRKPTEAPTPTLTPAFASAEAVQGSVRLSRGAQRLWQLLHPLAVQLALEKGYSRKVSQVVLALPQSLSAAALGYTDRHIRSLQGELAEAGLVASAALADNVEGRNLWSTTLWAVKVTTAHTRPHLTPEDFTHQWRDFTHDLKTRNTVQRMISGLEKTKEEKKIFVLFHVVVTGLFQLIPRYFSSFRPEMNPQAVRDAVLRLGTLAEDAPPGAVSTLACALAHGLGDAHSFRWWCKQLWKVTGSWERIGALQARLQRVLTDLDEYQDIRSAGAWTNSRVAIS